MKGLKHLGLFWQLCVERYRQLTPHERQAISEAIGESLDPAPSDQFSSPIRVIALIPAQNGGLVGWKTHRGHRLPSTHLQRGEQPMEALQRLMKSLGPFPVGHAAPGTTGVPCVDPQGHLVMAFRTYGCVATEDVAQAHRRHLIQGQPDVLVTIPPGALYECPVDAGLVAPVTEAQLKGNSLAIAS